MDIQMTEQQANIEISSLITQAREAIRKAEAIADKYDVCFSIDIGGYGMGGCYDSEDGWQASSQSC